MEAAGRDLAHDLHPLARPEIPVGMELGCLDASLTVPCSLYSPSDPRALLKVKAYRLVQESIFIGIIETKHDCKKHIG